MFHNIVDTRMDNESLNNDNQVLISNLASVSNQFDLTDSLLDVFTTTNLNLAVTMNLLKIYR